MIVKDFDEDDKHRISDSVSTAFYEGEGDVNLEINDRKAFTFSITFELGWNKV